MKELVVVSGKGGTGKTSITAAFATIAKGAVIADCDVDAPDIPLILEPSIRSREDFSGGKKAKIIPENCTACGICQSICRFDAISIDKSNGKYRVDPTLCDSCGVCVWNCPENAIEFNPVINGELFVSETRVGYMVHAHLGIAEENSGKLVTLIREKAKKIAKENGKELVIIDGPPGIGCPVIASMSNATLALAVTEPTTSGEFDLVRIIELTKNMSVPAVVVINKWDINKEVTENIEKTLKKLNVPLIGKIPYDRAFTEAQIHKKSIIEFAESTTTKTIKNLWKIVREKIEIEN
ncbi:ATP-binding protein [bacterium]|nr:ATP-binding protein [bacterium]